MLFGSTTYSKESRFVTEIPDDLLNKTGESGRFGSAYSGFASSGSKSSISVGTSHASKPQFGGYKKPAVQTGVVYNVGDCVLHKVFGKGLIMSAEKMGNDTLLEIAFDKAGTKKLMANFCKMEKI